MGGWAVSKARSSAPTRGAHIPGVFQPPPSGSAYYGQAYRYELSQHYKQWVFVAISAWIREVAGGAPPKFGKRTVRDPSRPKSAPVRKALGGIQEHHEFEPYDDDDPICRVFSNPNGPDVAYDLWAYHTLFKKLTGEAHWWVRRNTFQVPKEIWVIPTHWMRMVVDGDGQPEHYAIQSPWGRLQDIPYKDVVSFREHSPLNRYEGTPVAQACAEWLDSYEALTRMRLAVWKNGGVPAFHVRLGESYMDPDDAFLSRFYGKWFSRFGGEDNSGKPLITGADVEMKAIDGHRPAEALQASNQSEEHIRDQVLAAFGVPKAIVGLTDSMTYGSVTASQDAFRMFCLSEDTECLTAQGWRKHADLDLNTRVACFDPAADRIVYRQPSAVHRFDYKGPMCRWHARALDILVTPNHRMYVKSHNRTAWEVMEAKDVHATGTQYAVRTGAMAACAIPTPTLVQRYTGNGKPTHLSEIDPETWLEFLGYYLSEGHISKVLDKKRRCYSYQTGISQKRGSDAYDKIKGLLAKLPFAFRENPAGDPKYDVRQWVTNNKGLYELLAGTCGVGGARFKRVPDSVKDWPAGHLRILLDALIVGDGHEYKHTKKSWLYVTTSRQLADDVQELAVKCGIRALIGVHHAAGTHVICGRECKVSECYQVCLHDSDKYTLKGTYRSTEAYDGKVWCLTVPTGLFVVRRNGCVHVTGNSVNAELTYTGQVITEKIVRATPGYEDGVGYWEDRMAGDPDFKLRQEAQDLATGVKTVNQVKAARGDAPYEHGGDDPMVNGTVMPWATGKTATAQPENQRRAESELSGVTGDVTPDQTTAEPAEDGALRRAMGELTGAGGGYLLNGRGHGRN